MKFLNVALVFAIGLLISINGYAQAPAGSTGLCNDGSYYDGASKMGACKGHKGVKEWFGAATPAKTAATPAKTTAAAPAKSTAPATGGGTGQVWVNSGTKVYHCQGSKWYGKTKHGEYMAEPAAKAAGNHADHGKACTR